MFQIQKFKLMRLFFDWIWDLKPNFIGTYFHFLKQVSDFIALPPTRVTIQISRFWFWNFGVRGSVETRVLPAKLIL